MGLVLACGAGLLLVAWLARGERGLGRVAAQTQESRAGNGRAPAELSAVPASIEPATAPEEARREPAAERTAAQAEPEETARAGPVVVRVQLALESGEPRSFAGWKVEAQSWIEATGAVFPHERAADAAGRAEFRFPGFVHIDWLRCVPPAETGLALAYAEHHVDLDPGESLSETLTLAPGGVLVARVLDLAGNPVAGARVHAFADGGWELAPWQPGMAQAASGADGTVELPPLPGGTWALAVEPTDWLQVEPASGDRRGRGELERGARLEMHELLVAPLAQARVRVLDAAGRPVVAAGVETAPLELAQPGLAARERAEPDALAVFLGRAEPRVEGSDVRRWPHGELYWTTDERGEARVLGVAGRWSVLVHAPLGTGTGEDESLQAELQLPGPDLTVRVPGALAELRGRIVDEGGRALERVTIGLVRGDDDDWSGEAESAEDGTFLLRGLPRGREYVLSLWERAHLPVRTSVWVGGDVDAGTLELRRAHTLRVHLVDTNGAPVAQKPLAIVARRPRAPLRPDEEAWFAQRSRISRSTDQEGRAEFGQLPAGEVELTLSLPFAGPPDAQGNTPIQQRVFKTWVVPVSAEEQRLEVDLTGYAAPVPRQAPSHRGVVVDARSGAPLAGAWVVLRFPSWVQQARTSADGRFRLGAPQQGSHGLVALHPGYLPFEVPAQDWAPGVNEHRLALLPGPPPLEFEFLDREGERLPRADVILTAPDGARLLTVVRTGGSPFLLHGQRFGTTGSLVFESLSPGPLRYALSVGGHELGSGTLDAGATSGPVAVRLERSLAELRRTLEELAEDE
ncbi:MAG TPA: carboxypeptidase regulatory-like domain-containing protein [Planctomycetota bacterium]